MRPTEEVEAEHAKVLAAMAPGKSLGQMEKDLAPLTEDKISDIIRYEGYESFAVGGTKREWRKVTEDTVPQGRPNMKDHAAVTKQEARQEVAAAIVKLDAYKAEHEERREHIKALGQETREMITQLQGQQNGVRVVGAAFKYAELPAPETISVAVEEEIVNFEEVYKDTLRKIEQSSKMLDRYDAKVKELKAELAEKEANCQRLLKLLEDARKTVESYRHDAENWRQRKRIEDARKIALAPTLQSAMQGLDDRLRREI
jgi:chromosome segregation ATPase